MHCKGIGLQGLLLHYIIRQWCLRVCTMTRQAAWGITTHGAQICQQQALHLCRQRAAGTACCCQARRQPFAHVLEGDMRHRAGAQGAL